MQLRDFGDSENISKGTDERWELFRIIIMTTTDSAQGKVENMKYRVWFHTECEYVNARVYRTYDRIQQRNHTLNAVEVYHIV
jgi:hypothetical protein